VNLAALDLEGDFLQGNDPWKFFGYILKLKNDIVLHSELLGFNENQYLAKNKRLPEMGVRAYARIPIFGLLLIIS
jgi:hypothetical protein